MGFRVKLPVMERKAWSDVLIPVLGLVWNAGVIKSEA